MRGKLTMTARDIKDCIYKHLETRGMNVDYISFQKPGRNGEPLAEYSLEDIQAEVCLEIQIQETEK